MRLLLCVLAALLALPTVASASGGVDVQLLSLNDFHGHLETTTPGTIKPFDTGSSSDPSVASRASRSEARRSTRARRTA